MNRRQWLLGCAGLLTACRLRAPVQTGKVVGCGDSIMDGNHVGAGEVYLDLVASALPAVPIVNLAVPSSSIDSAGQGALVDAEFDGSKGGNICIVGFGANDMISQDGTAYHAELKAFCLARKAKGFRVLVITTLPCGSYAEAIDRSTVANGLTRADPSYYDGLIDIGVGSAHAMGDVDAINDGALYSDTVHPTAAGNVLIEPDVTAAITAVLANASAGAGRNL